MLQLTRNLFKQTRFVLYTNTAKNISQYPRTYLTNTNPKSKLWQEYSALKSVVEGEKTGVRAHTSHLKTDAYDRTRLLCLNRNIQCYCCKHTYVYTV